MTGRPTRSTPPWRMPKVQGRVARTSSRTPKSATSWWRTAAQSVCVCCTTAWKAKSAPPRWCWQRACGATGLRVSMESDWPCRRRSTSTSSPRRWRVCPPTCRCCACRTNGRITRKTPASCCWAHSNLSRNPGPCRVSPRTSASTSCRRTWTISNRCSARRWSACRFCRPPASPPGSTGLRASRRMIAICWVKPPRCATCSWPAASTPSASRVQAGPARCWPNGFATAMCRSTCPGWKFGACTPARAPVPTWPTAPLRAWACCMPCTGHFARSRPRGAHGAARFTNDCWRLVHVWVSSAAGSAPTGMAHPGHNRATSTASGTRTGSTTPPKNAVPRGMQWPCSTSRRCQNSWCRGATPARC